MKPLSKPAFVCASCARMLRQRSAATTTATFSTSSSNSSSSSANATSIDRQLPRYRQTPPAMKMPYRIRPLPRQPEWRVNQDEEALNAAYDEFLPRIGGNNVRGRDLLDDQTKWLALTHKSFDHGRQGFNDRLAFLGRRIVETQASLALLNAPAGPALSSSTSSSSSSSSAGTGDVFRHPALEGVENVTALAKQALLSPRRLAALASSYGLDKVVRWKPKKSGNLRASGAEVVMAQAVFGVVGALALRNGGQVAARAGRERVLQPLGLR